MKLYKEHILDHYENPRNKGVIEAANMTSGSYNPSCGDAVSISGIIERNRIKNIGFQASGCVISQAAASIITEYVFNKPIDEIEAITTDDVVALIQLPLGPTRLRCALLPLEAIQNAIKQYKEQNHGS